MCVYGAEGAMGSSLGQAKRSPRSQAAAEIGPEGTEAAAKPFFRPFRTVMRGRRPPWGCASLTPGYSLSRLWRGFGPLSDKAFDLNRFQGPWILGLRKTEWDTNNLGADRVLDLGSRAHSSWNSGGSSPPLPCNSSWMS